MLINNFRSPSTCQRDKNKELEAKNRDLDRKFREEKALREKVETRNAELRKKLRDAKVETTVPVKQSDHAGIADGKDTSNATDKIGISTAKGKEVLSTSTGTTTPTKTKANSSNTMVPSPSNQSMASEVTRKAGSLQKTSKEPPRTASTSLGTGKNGESTRKPGSSSTGPVSNKSVAADTSRKVGTSQSSASAAQVSTPSKGTAATASLKGSSASLGTNQKGKAPSVSAKSTMSKADSSQSSKLEAKNANEQLLHAKTIAATDPELTSRTSANDNSPSKGNQNVSHSQPASRTNDTLVSSARQPTNGNRPPNHRATQSLHDFDPLRSNANVAANSNTVVPVISLPTSYSFEATDLNGTFMSQNPFMVPVAFEMAPAPRRIRCYEWRATTFFCWWWSNVYGKWRVSRVSSAAAIHGGSSAATNHVATGWKWTASSARELKWSLATDSIVSNSSHEWHEWISAK